MTLTDHARTIPIQLYFPAHKESCTPTQRCPVALVSAGYGVSNLAYSFIAESLTGLGYLVVSIQHQLPGDAPLTSDGDIYKNRTPNWQRGAQNIRFVQHYLSSTYAGFDWQHPILVGHSNGGDISAWLIKESSTFASAIITLDNRRVPLPRGVAPRVLSIRASDFSADEGVLPTEDEALQFGTCIVKINGAHHNDMQDDGSPALKSKITHAIETFLRPSATDGKQYACDSSSSLD
ncbi:Alpha/beta hydrolase family [Solimicrobium silvestre]|uniref:Alpha/beta hydrolase family n=2 Tax=Solimicrobium silvestre TaxID=2099400 RepID=A0A2S9H5I1_9BURK|nr:Alpha/beta hydrolase family [Solimicrobium silvestre]